MSPDKDKALREKYPLVFQTPLANDEPIRCGDGWYGLLDTLCAQLQRLIEAEPVEEQPRYRAFQVKEKFGQLRFYLWNALTPEMQREIDGAEFASSFVCDVCGKVGQLRTIEHIVATRCDEHKDTTFAHGLAHP